MPTRRETLKFITRIFMWTTAMTQLGLSKGAILFAQVKKRILPKNTDPAGLKKENPADLDTRHLKVMPTGAFGTMGDKEAPFDPKTWRLEVTGAVRNPFKISHADLLNMPAIEREVLMVCPGVFSNHGRWRGISINDIIEKADSLKTVSKVRIFGYSDNVDRKETFTMEEARLNKVFLAYGVNGRPLPRKHGFPLRVVAEDHYGFNWAKYVFKIEFVSDR